MTQAVFNPAAIIVTFHPDVPALLTLVATLSSQVNKIYVVDNTPSGFGPLDFDLGHPSADLIRLGDNLGLAAGQNVGIGKARREGFSHVLLMDQDSEPEANMVEVLFDQLSKLQQAGVKVAAVGPQLVNARTGELRSFAAAGNGHQKHGPNEKNTRVYCDYLVASGSLIPSKVLDEVGEMDEELFIDCVDIEWAHRAAAKGFVFIGVPMAEMRYTQGDAQWTVLGCPMAKYPPLRLYYFFRNTCELATRSYIHSHWKRHVLLRSPLYALLLFTVTAPRLQNVNMVVRGLSHGIRHRLGPMT